MHGVLMPLRPFGGTQGIEPCDRLHKTYLLSQSRLENCDQKRTLFTFTAYLTLA